MKEKKSILEKFGLIEKVQPASENNPKEVEKEIAVEIEREIPIVKPVIKPAAPVKTAENPNALRGTDEMIKNKRPFTADEVFGKYNVGTEGVNSLYIVESFLKALPVYLPIDIKRESMVNIVSTSGAKMENLIKDGNEKLRSLKEFSRSFTNDSNASITNCEEEIRKLNEKIENYRKVIGDMKKLQEDQEDLLKSEIERINNILEFINPKG